MAQTVIVLDCGGQYKELIARMVRGLNVYAEILPGDVSLEVIREKSPIGIILTGGPMSVYAPDAPKCDPSLFSLGVPVLGICYGMQLMCHTLGGEVGSGSVGEYGQVEVKVTNGTRRGNINAKKPLRSLLFSELPASLTALMSHGDAVQKLPEGFAQTARTVNCIAACEDARRKLYAVQFHPETSHTPQGAALMRNFLYKICGAKGDYQLKDFIAAQVKAIRAQVGTEKVLLALSGGVDSSVLAALLAKAVPGQLVCVFVDHGLMRLNEGDEVEAAFAGRDLHFIRINAQERFLEKLAGVTDPERKRKIIGEEFIRVFEEEAAKLCIPYLAQGTIYPDIVESGGAYGATIKSHHNVGGLPEKLNFKELVEPLQLLFKNEVREVGKRLKLPASLVNRQPFPGPGLAVRVTGEITQAKLDVLRRADAIFREELAKLRTKPSQYFAVLTDTLAVGVKGDARTYDPVIALRAVTTDDFMTATATPLPHRILARAAARITNEIPEASRVVYDITSKPPATVEWL